MTFAFSENRAGYTSIGGIDTGISTPNAAAGVTIPSPPMVLGQVVRGVDPVLGEGQFILLKGVAATQVGSCVIWDGSFATTLCPATANQARPVAFAMSANVSPTSYAWYQVAGQVSALKDTGNAVNANVAVGIVSTGAIGNTAAGLEIEGARSTNTGTVAAGTTVLPIYCDHPNLQGRIT